VSGSVKRQINWEQVDLRAALIRLEGEQTKSDQARPAPIPDVLNVTLQETEPREGFVFDRTNLPKEWLKARDGVVYAR
jgi:hypothetical protein